MHTKVQTSVNTLKCSNYTCCSGRARHRIQESVCDRIDGDYFAGKPLVAFRIKDVPFYFDQRLRISSADGGPRPLIDDPIAFHFVRQKPLVKVLLREQGFAVPEGAAFTCEEQRKAETYFPNLSSPRPEGVCMKPADAGGGRLVHLGVRDHSSFDQAFTAISERHD